jgi:hypothetical protein
MYLNAQYLQPSLLYLGPEEGEATGRAEDASHDVLGGFLKPMADGVLESLIPLHKSRA